MKHEHSLIIFLLWFAFSCQGPPQESVPFPVHADWKAALGAANSNGKPILMIFDWHGSSVDGLSPLRSAAALPIVKANYNVAWVALDNSQPLPDDTIILDRKGNRIKTLGGWYNDLQTRNFPDHFRPMYALFSPEGKPILLKNKPLYCGYVQQGDEKGLAEFAEMLRAGAAAH